MRKGVLKIKDLLYPGSLHSHTDFSNFRLRDCINTVEGLIDRAIELGHTGLAVTEHETIASSLRALRYYKKVKEDNPNFKLVLGNEIYLTRNGLNAKNYDRNSDRYYHFILLAKDAIGHEQIRRLSTAAWGNAYMARGMMRVPTYYQNLWDIIGENPGHVIGTNACLGGVLGTQLMRYMENPDKELLEKIENWVLQMAGLFGEGNFFLELQPSHTKEQIFVNKKVLEIAEKFDLPYIISLDAHYLSKKDRPVHKAFLTAQQGDREVDDFYASTYMMDTAEILSYMDSYMSEEQFEIAFSNTQKILNECEDYELEKAMKVPYRPIAPIEPKEGAAKEWENKIPLLSKFATSTVPSERHLAAEIILRLEEKEFQTPQVYEEIEKNLDAIRVSSEASDTSWSAYLLNVRDCINLIWEEGDSLVGAGRGSGAGFFLLYLLGITQINPLREKAKTYYWRFLHGERASVVDIDIDTEKSKRQKIYRAFQKTYGADRVSRVLTLRTEKSKSAILTSCRGLGVDPDTAQYISSLITSDRGILRTLSQVYYGDKEEGIHPNKEFVRLMDEEYPEVWEVARNIEGLINGVGSHAGGVILVDEDFSASTALMKTSSGEIVTQFDLDDAERVGLIKIDILSIEALDKIRVTLDLLQEYGYIETEKSLRETYEETVGIYNLERDALEMWEMAWNHEVQSLFQLEKQSGVQGVALTKPQSVEDLAMLNSLIRLMPSERGMELPLNKFARFKENPKLWTREMERYGLSTKDQAILRPILEESYGICETQEKFMRLVQLPEIGGHSLLWADRLRKAVAKKHPAEYDELTEEFFQAAQEKNLSSALTKYVWNVLVATNRGYGFNTAHTLSYSLIGLQELNLAYRFPTIFWNTANLIVDSGGDEPDLIEDEASEEIEIIYSSGPNVFNDYEEDEEDEGEKVIKKYISSTNYGKIASAIGRFQASGLMVSPPDINKSKYTFSPDVESNEIKYGLSGITLIGEEPIRQIITNRPYKSVEDFVAKVKLNKPQIINLIKAGAFDQFGDRVELMRNYIDSISDVKKVLNLRNMQMLIREQLIPDELDHVRRVFNFNLYLKKFKNGLNFRLDSKALTFYEKHYPIENLQNINDMIEIDQKVWDKIYQKEMNPARAYIKENQKELLQKVNEKAVKDMWDKYCLGSISKWEMDSVSYYSHKHELEDLALDKLGLVEFYDLPEEPIVDRIITIKGRPVPLYVIHRVVGTVLDRDKLKKTVTLLTPKGVASVRIFGDAFTKYDRQISELDMTTGKRKVIEKSMFSRGNKLIVTGIRRGQEFIAKKYARTPFHMVEQIISIDESGMIETKERA